MSNNIKNVEESPRAEPLSSNLNEAEQIDILQKEKEKLTNAIKEKEEHIRKLNLVKMYQSKHKLDELDELILKWRSAAQDASTDYYNMFDQPKPEQGDFLKQLHVDLKTIRYDSESESFY